MEDREQSSAEDPRSETVTATAGSSSSESIAQIEVVVQVEVPEGSTSDPSGFKEPPPSPTIMHQNSQKPHLGQGPRSGKHRRKSVAAAAAPGTTDDHQQGRRRSSELRDSFAALSRSKSRTITFSAAEAGDDPEGKGGDQKALDECEDDLDIDEKIMSSWKRKSCKCMVAFAGDCAALCCCPCTILHLLALICLRLPLTVLYGVYSRVRRRRRRRSKSRDVLDGAAAVVAKQQSRSSFNAWPFGEQLVIDFPPYPGGFGDEKHWSFFESGSDGSVGSSSKAKQHQP